MCKILKQKHPFRIGKMIAWHTMWSENDNFLLQITALLDSIGANSVTSFETLQSVTTC